MPTKNKIYTNAKFPPEIIKDAYNMLLSFLSDENKLSYSKDLHVSINEKESWSYENEDEFFQNIEKILKVQPSEINIMTIQI
ncbi:MAG: hypothetical protein K9I26_04220 [Flavobacterium sp.]|nr:hypothetical protein [Flavobacterium sp.]